MECTADFEIKLHRLGGATLKCEVCFADVLQKASMTGTAEWLKHSLQQLDRGSEGNAETYPGQEGAQACCCSFIWKQPAQLPGARVAQAAEGAKPSHQAGHLPLQQRDDAERPSEGLWPAIFEHPAKSSWLCLWTKEILNSRSDNEQLKPDGSDFKLIKSLLDYHPSGPGKTISRSCQVQLCML